MEYKTRTHNNGYSSMPASPAHGKFTASQRSGEFAGTSSIANRWLTLKK